MRRRCRRARLGPGRLLREEAGAVAVIVALTFSAIFLAVAVAIDFAEAYRASDGATLAQAFEAIAREIAKLRIAS